MNAPHAYPHRESFRNPGVRRSSVLLACIGVALALGVVATAAGPAPSFTRPTYYGTGDGPEDVAIGDLNGDGKPDLVTANFDVNSVSVLVNKGKGSFQASRDYPTGKDPSSVALGDLNGDGKPDLATANLLADTVSVLLNNGDGSFQAKVDYRTGTEPGSVAIGDVNGDDKQDLVTTSSPDAVNPGNTVSVLLNRGDGTFQAKVDYPTGSDPSSVAIGDLNDDAKPDLVITNVGTYAEPGKTVSVLLNRGDGTFQAKVDYPTGREPDAVAIRDVNADDKPDLVIANFNSQERGPGNTVSVLLGRGDGTFRPGGAYRTGDGPRSVALGDLNGDGKPDLATANFGVDTVSVLVNRGDGRFDARRDYPARGNSVAIGDLNGDGKPDLVTANDPDNVSVRLNTTGLCAAPNVIGKRLLAAKRTITRARCRVGKIRHAFSKVIKRGRVISEMPKPGTVLRKGGKVSLVVSRGRRR